MSDLLMLPPGTARTLQNLLEELYGGDVNEATMTANFLAPVLRKLFGEVQLEAECTMSLQFGVSAVVLDTRRSSGVTGRADFFLRDKVTGKVMAVVEAKKPSHALDEVDDEQVKSYMRAILPLIPFGVVVNANEPSRLFGWKDGDIVKLDESCPEPLLSIPGSIDRELVQAAVRALMRATPAYRDDAINQICRRQLEISAEPSKSPRSIVQALSARIHGEPATVSFVVSPPKCGKSQVLRDLAEDLSGRPIIFVTQDSEQRYALAEAVGGFEVDGQLSDPIIIRFLKARAALNSPIYILIDASATSQELIDLIAFVSDMPGANTHLVISASFQVARKLLFRNDFTPFFRSSNPIDILEIGAFTDKELAAAFPESFVSLAQAPFGRLLRWPGLRHAVSSGANLRDTLFQWFQSCPPPIRRAMSILGAELAKTSDWSADRLPITFVSTHSQELDILLECGFVVELPRARSGLSNYGVACIEIGLYALLSHIFEAAPDENRSASLDAFVARWKRVQSEQEMVVLAAILPTFLAGASGDPLDRIVRYMLSISFGSYVLETTSRSRLFAEYADSVDSQVETPHDLASRRTSFELLRKALLMFRNRVGLMPDFSEVERELGETVRFFDGGHNPVLKMKLSVEQWQDHTILLKLGRAALLDSLYLLSKGDISWLPDGLDQDAIRRIAVAIAEVATPYRAGFPIESRFEYLVDIITRRYPRDLPLLLKAKQWLDGRLSGSEQHIRNLGHLVIDSYRSGSWEHLSDCFAYTHVMSDDLLELLLTGLLGEGSDTSFANVIINFPQDCFAELPISAQKRILDRLIAMEKGVGRVVAHFDKGVLKFIRNTHPAAFSRISELVWEFGFAPSILRMLASREAVDNSIREGDFWRLVAIFDMPTLCLALSTSDFFEELFSIMATPIADVRTALDSHASVGRGWELLMEALCLLQRNGELLVSDNNWLDALCGSSVAIEDWVLNAPEPERQRQTQWSVEHCAEYIRSKILQAARRKELYKIDRTLRSALLTVHDTKFNRIYVRVAVAMASECDAYYRMMVAKRLILSGFDLWEVSLNEYTCPMLRDLLDEIAVTLRRKERHDWIKWIVRHYHRLRMLPTFSIYSIRELVSVKAIRREFLQMVSDKISEDIRSVLPLVDMSLSSFRDPEGLAETLLEAIAESSEDIDGFRSRFPDELDEIQAFAPEQHENDLPMLGADDILDAFEQATNTSPQFPALLPAWTDYAPVRSMLSPVGERGYHSYTIEEFKNSFIRKSC